MESIIRAPIAGMVLELPVNEGDPVVPLTSYQAGTPLATLADMRQLVFKGTVDEIDVGKLHEGMPARIKIGALPEAEVEGKRLQDRAQVQDPGGRDPLRRGDRAPARRGPTLRAGYSANADVVVREKPDVLLLPERLVTFKDGKATVEVPGAGEAPPVAKEVKTGLSDGLNVEIAEGLQEKDLVVERPPKKIE